jgi:hypothetical protein
MISNFIRSFSKQKIKDSIFVGFYIMNWNFVGYCTYKLNYKKVKYSDSDSYLSYPLI